jgi:hypothetical protein
MRGMMKMTGTDHLRNKQILNDEEQEVQRTEGEPKSEPTTEQDPGYTLNLTPDLGPSKLEHKPDPTPDPKLQDPFADVSKRSLRFLPLFILVPILYWALFKSMGYDLNWKAFGLGALGWAQSVGQGWAAIEVLYTMISVIMITLIINRTDENPCKSKKCYRRRGIFRLARCGEY